MSQSNFYLRLAGYDKSPDLDVNAYNDGPTRTRTTKKVALLAVGAGKMDTLWAEDTDDSGTGLLATSAIRAIDLKTETDARGVALALSDVALLYIVHKASSASVSISLNANAADGWTNLIATSARSLTLRPGDFIVIGAFTAGNLPVGASDKVLDIKNDDGSNEAAYKIEVWGRK